MNAVGIDVSKGKSMVAIMRPFGRLNRYEVAQTGEKYGCYYAAFWRNCFHTL